MNSKVSFGSDPEFFLSKDGQYFSAIDIVPGSIGDRFRSGDHQFYWDNMLAECAVKPGFSREEVVENTRDCLKRYTEIIEPYIMEARASVEFDQSQLKDHRCRVSGCNPDICSYSTRIMKPDEKIIKNTPLRSGGGHIHLGSTSGFLREDGPERILLVYLMDLFLAVPSLYLDPDPTSVPRRKIYGHAGRYRATNYGIEDTPTFATGIEYRPLGNFWLRGPKFVELIYDLTMFVIDFINNKKYDKLWSFDEDKFYRVSERKMHTAFRCTGYDVQLLRKVVADSMPQDAGVLFSVALEHLTPDLGTRIINSIEPWTSREDYRAEFYREWGLKL